MKYPYSPQIHSIGFEKTFAIFIPILLPKHTHHFSITTPHLLFEVRASTLRHQPFEICFPGGKIETFETSEQAAIRETKEELLVHEHQLQLLTPTDYIITPSNRILYPYIGLVKDYAHTYNKDEVAETFFVPLSYFQAINPMIYYNKISILPADNFPFEKMPNKTTYNFEGGTYPVPFYDYNNRVIWGLTARIIQAMLPRLEDMKHELY